VTGDHLRRSFWRGAVAILVAAALVAIAALVRGELGETDGKILLTLLALLVAGGTAVAGLVLVERGLLGGTGWVVAATSAAGFLAVTAATWESFEDDTLSRLAGTAAVVVPVLLVLTSQVLLLRDPGLVLLVVVSALTLGLAAALMTAGIWSDDMGEEGLKAVAVLTIVGALCWLLVPVLQRLRTAPAPHLARGDGTERHLTTLDALDVIVDGETTGAALVIEQEPGGLVVTSPTGRIHLRPGEQLVLRRRTGGT